MYLSKRRKLMRTFYHSFELERTPFSLYEHVHEAANSNNDNDLPNDLSRPN